MANKSSTSVPALNPPFDPIFQYSGKFDTPTVKGYMRSDPNATFTSSSGPQPGRVNFLFNPSQLSLQHSMNPNVATAQAALPDQSPGMGTIMGVYGTTAYSLLFDRQPDVWKGKSKQGVYDDVNAFYRLVGITTKKSGMPTTPMAWTPVCIYFGPILSVYGYINELDVTYTAWSKDLIPIRAQIDISVTLQTPTGKGIPGFGLS